MLPVGKQNGAAALENSLTAPQKTIWLSDSISRYLCERNHNVFPHKVLSTNIHSSVVHDSQGVETGQVSARTETSPPCGLSVQQNAARPWKGMILATAWINLGKSLPAGRSQMPKDSTLLHLYETSRARASGNKGTEGLLKRMGLLSEVTRMFLSWPVVTTAQLGIY